MFTDRISNNQPVTPFLFTLNDKVKQSQLQTNFYQDFCCQFYLMPSFLEKQKYIQSTQKIKMKYWKK